MSKLIIENLFNKELKISTRTSLIQLLQEEYIDLMHACGGKGRCTTCKLIIYSGEESLCELSPFEQRCRENGVLKKNERLACQAKVKIEVKIGNIVAAIPEEYQLPHIKYS